MPKLHYTLNISIKKVCLIVCLTYFLTLHCIAIHQVNLPY
nr:MAG TPA: hypothetical protein [Caudoviricetes sp.]